MSGPPDLIRRMVEAAERQLAAARSLSADALHDATVERRELLFELQLYGDRVTVDAQTAQALDLLDRRLQALLSAGLAIFGAGTQPRASPTYGADGRLRNRG